MDETEALGELDAVLGGPEEPTGPTEEPSEEQEPEYPEGTCFACGAELNPVHDRENECQHCFYGRLSVAQRCDIVAEMVAPIAAQWGEAEVLAKLKEATALACTLAESRDHRLVGQWADGFFAGLVASGKLPANRGLTDSAVSKLIADVNSDPVPTGD